VFASDVFVAIFAERRARRAASYTTFEWASVYLDVDAS
jgi:hypothetical protein